MLIYNNYSKSYVGILAITGWMTFDNGPEELPEMSDLSIN
jgi:hypothetical protein